MNDAGERLQALEIVVGEILTQFAHSDLEKAELLKKALNKHTHDAVNSIGLQNAIRIYMSFLS